MSCEYCRHNCTKLHVWYHWWTWFSKASVTCTLRKKQNNTQLYHSYILHLLYLYYVHYEAKSMWIYLTIHHHISKPWALKLGFSTIAVIIVSTLLKRLFTWLFEFCVDLLYSFNNKDQQWSASDIIRGDLVQSQHSSLS